MTRDTRGIKEALVAAAFFGATTPFAKQLGVDVHPQVFAGLLYFGSGSILAASLVFIPSKGRESRLQRSDAPALLGAVLFGGVIAPILLLVGLQTTTAASASLLLNLEVVFTAVGAWVLAREHASKRVVAGMVAILFGGSLLSLDPSGKFALSAGAIGIVGACACWGIDNVVTRPLSMRDPRQVAAVKGIVAGSFNISLGMILGGELPSLQVLAATVGLGFLGYGVSLVLAVRAMRFLGTARTGAYYAAAPFVGAAVATAWLREPVSQFFVPALVLMALGLFLHLTEVHRHDHHHLRVQHEHAHVADLHQGHRDELGEHAVLHTHEEMTHTHDHTPDEHHRHAH
jgi:drug/metabolite transporter (DMT)-like permease